MGILALIHGGPLQQVAPTQNIPAMDDLKAMGGRLRALRVERGLSQEEAARKANISSKSISRHERGENQPGVLDVAALARIYNVSLEYIIGASAHRSGLPVSSGHAPRLAAHRNRTAPVPSSSSLRFGGQFNAGDQTAGLLRRAVTAAGSANSAAHALRTNGL